jgi:NAD(P)-dependent dehydrogenase (short-subunit alcohol dehydrogenase family)
MGLIAATALKWPCSAEGLMLTCFASASICSGSVKWYAGYFEELTPEQMDVQLETRLVGPMNVTRAVLPVMREQRAGHIIAISSSAGLSGFGCPRRSSPE